MHLRPLLGSLLCLTSCVTVGMVGAQTPTALMRTPPPTGAAGPVAPNAARAVTFDTWSAADSRLAFVACDTNGDDRLSIFEATRAIENLGTLHSVQAFRDLDVNADGFLEWPEFDARFRRIIDNGLPFRIRPQRPIELLRSTTPLPGSATVPATRAESFVRSLDRNGDEQLDRTEIQAFLRSVGLESQAAMWFRSLDRDGSGALSVSELAGLVDRFPAPGTSQNVETVTTEGRGVLPTSFHSADANQDGVIDADEWHRALLRIHPSLARHSAWILADADANRSGSLGAAELRPFVKTR